MFFNSHDFLANFFDLQKFFSMNFLGLFAILVWHDSLYVLGTACMIWVEDFLRRSVMFGNRVSNNFNPVFTKKFLAAFHLSWFTLFSKNWTCSGYNPAWVFLGLQVPVWLRFKMETRLVPHWVHFVRNFEQSPDEVFRYLTYSEVLYTQRLPSSDSN